MAVTQISRLQHRRGLRIDLPVTLNDAEFGWAEDTLELFIGNGPLAPQQGNTQILTQYSPASLPSYVYESNTGGQAITGFDPFGGDPAERNANFATVRNYQDKFDDFVSVYDYGAKGDGVTDDWPALKRAIEDIYDEFNSIPVANPRKFRALRFPAGTYMISKSLLMYPFIFWYGEGKDRTKIVLMDAGSSPLPDQTCVARTCDSKGQVGTNIDGSADLNPGFCRVFGLSFINETTQNAPIGEKDVIKLDSVSNVRFEDCEFAGIWDVDDLNPIESRSISVEDNGSLGSSITPLGNYSFVNCNLRNTAYGFGSSINNLRDIFFLNNKFYNHNTGVRIGESGTETIGAVRVSHSSFDKIGEIGFNVITTATKGHVSSFNYYKGNGASGEFNTAAVVFAANTDGCVSVNDFFEDDTAATCAAKLTNPRVRNLSTLRNIVMNAQDEFQIPNGFCGDISIDGNLSITGSVVNTNVAVTPTPFAPGDYLITSVPLSDGNVIFVEYGMNQSSTIYRSGVLRVVHDGDGVTASNIDYVDNYNELNGPPAAPITLSASINVTAIDIILSTTGAVPDVNFNIRVMQV